MQATLLVPRRDDTLYRRETSLNFIVKILTELTETMRRCAVQRLRYRVFFSEMDAIPVAAAERYQMDVNEYSDIADHVIVADTAGSNSCEYVVGTYRLIRRGRAMRCGGFYSTHEFDIARLLRRPREILSWAALVTIGITEHFESSTYCGKASPHIFHTIMSRFYLAVCVFRR